MQVRDGGYWTNIVGQRVGAKIQGIRPVQGLVCGRIPGLNVGRGYAQIVDIFNRGRCAAIG